MKLFTFKGGIHPPDMKSLTMNIPTAKMSIPDELIIPLSQHTGAACSPVVQKGDRVLKGQLIGRCDSMVTAFVHASTSGEVTDIKPYIHPLGIKINSVFLKADKLDESVSGMQGSADFEKMQPSEIMEKIKNSGVVGMGGAAFPTHIKLSPPSGINIDTLIINGAECEPFLTSDYRLIIEQKQKLITGIKILLRALGVKNAFIGIEDNKPDALKLLKDCLANESYIKLSPLKTKYPQGSEKQLIKAITGRSVPGGKLPFNVGVVVQNVGTVIAVYDAVINGLPLTERVVTVSGTIIKNPANLTVKIGTKFSDVIAFVGGLKEPAGKILMGGPMMGIAVSNLDVPVIKGTSGIIALSLKESRAYDARACIRCGMCLRSCPMGLVPFEFVDLNETDNLDGALQKNVLYCMECGSCAYICPSKRPMVQSVKLLKFKLQKREKSKNERAR